MESFRYIKMPTQTEIAMAILTKPIFLIRSGKYKRSKVLFKEDQVYLIDKELCTGFSETPKHRIISIIKEGNGVVLICVDVDTNEPVVVQL